MHWKNTDGDTPLLAACRRGHTETIALLVACGSNVNVIGSDSFTPLHVCTRRGDAESVNILLNANVNTLARTKEGQTALDIAQVKGYETIYARLMRKRSGISPKTSSGTIDGVRGSHASGVTASTDDTTARISNRPHWVESKKKQTLSQVIQSNIQNDYRVDEEFGTDSNSSNITINNNNNSSSSVSSKSQRLPSSSKKYTIMGTTINSNDASSGDETATIGLRKLLDQEQSARKAIELKVRYLLCFYYKSIREVCMSGDSFVINDSLIYGILFYSWRYSKSRTHNYYMSTLYYPLNWSTYRTS